MLRVESEGPVVRMTLDRPEVRNAFDDELIEAMHQAFESLPKGTRAVVLSGEGDVFCAGGDLNWMRRTAGYSDDQNYRDALRLAGLFEAISRCPAAVIARVHGPAYGGACGLVAAADIALASQAARFAFSEVRIGLVPATISPFVIRKIGAGAARALFTTGEVFDAERAYQIGLVHFVGPLPDLDKELRRKLDSILSAGPRAVAEAKRIALEPPMNADQSARLLATVRSGEEAREGIGAFLDKRKAAYVKEIC
ncbi:MAG TPA: enoyl-CoA hydratase-related protein [Fimbriimonas sp.]